MRFIIEAECEEGLLPCFKHTRFFSYGLLATVIHVTQQRTICQKGVPNDSTRAQNRIPNHPNRESALHRESSHYGRQSKTLHDEVAQLDNDLAPAFCAAGPCSKLLGAESPACSRTDCQNLWP